MEHVSDRRSAIRTGHASPGRWLLNTLLRLDAGYRQRHALKHLDAHIRRDIGLPECDKPRWQPPVVMSRSR